MKRILFILFCFLLKISFAQNSEIGSAAKRFLATSALECASYSVCFVDVGTKNVVVDLSSKRAVVPASVLKLVTTATALETFGADYQFSTEIYIQGAITHRTLNGNLIIHGGGDPTLGSQYFNMKTSRNAFLAEWIAQVKQAGIDSITGDILVDPSVYSDQEVPQTWIWEDLGNHFGAAAQGISIYDNAFELVFKTENRDGGWTKVISTDPEIPSLTLDNQVKASDVNRDRAYVFGSPFDQYRIIRGTLPKGKPEFRVKASIPDPSIVLGTEWMNAMKSQSIFIGGTVAKAFNLLPDSTLTLLYSHQSPRLADIIRQTNVHSVNLFAENYCKQLGIKLKGEGSTNAGCQAIDSFWRSKVHAKSLFLADGSGLSRANGISADVLTQILVEMTHSPNYQTFYNSLPIAGEEGTMANYFRESPVKGKIRVKSGSMTRVRSLAGYMTTARGNRVAFALMVNNFSGTTSEVILPMEQLIETVYLQY